MRKTPHTLLSTLSFGTLAVVVVVLMVGTIVERCCSAAIAMEKIYTSWWMIALWAVMAVAGVLYAAQCRMWQRVYTCGLHGALVLILAGALTTHLTGVRGHLHLRHGMPPVKTFYTTDGSEQVLPFLLTLDAFEVERYPESDAPKDYVSHLILTHRERGTTTGVVSMNKILKHRGYRLYQTDYDEDLQGTLLTVSHDPYGIGLTYAGYLLLLFSMMGFFVQRESGFRHLLRSGMLAVRIVSMVGIGCGVLLATVVVLSHTHGDQPLIPVLRSPLLGIHVAVIMMAYALLATIVICGIVAEVQHCRKGDHNHAIRQLYIAGRLLLYPALFLLTAGIFIGAVWANVSWGRYWGWDPKEVWALVTMLVYAVPLHSRSVRWLANPMPFLRYCMVAFLCVLITYFGVNLLLGGMHSYA